MSTSHVDWKSSSLNFWLYLGHILDMLSIIATVSQLDVALCQLRLTFEYKMIVISIVNT